MGERRRCPGCRRLFVADPRVGDRQRTCGRNSCRRQHKNEYDRQWRDRHPEYFRGCYEQQKEVYGSRAGYKRGYRESHPEYVQRNAAYVRAWRRNHAKEEHVSVSPTSCDLRVTLTKEASWLAITNVSHTSRDIFVTLCSKDTSSPVSQVSPTSSDSSTRSAVLS